MGEDSPDNGNLCKPVVWRGHTWYGDGDKPYQALEPRAVFQVFQKVHIGLRHKRYQQTRRSTLVIAYLKQRYPIKDEH